MTPIRFGVDTVFHKYLTWSRLSLIGESPLFGVGKMLDFMLARMILLINMTLRNQERKMMECMLKDSYESKSLRISITNMITNEVSTNNGQSQIKFS